MKYCIRCGAKLEDRDNFCPVCGLRQWAAPGAAEAEPAGGPKAEGTAALPRPATLLVWSLFLFFLVNPVGTPAAAAALLLTALAHSGGAGAPRQLRAARSLCIVAGVADGIAALIVAMAALIRLAGIGF